MLDVLKTAAWRLVGSADREDGQALTEYALVIALVVLIAIVSLTLLGSHTSSLLTSAAPTP